MGDEDKSKIKDTAEAIKGLVEAVPVYQDALQPAAKEVGKSLLTVTKLVNVALTPLSLLVWGYDRIKDYLEATLAEKLKDVPPERIVTPSPAVAGPAVEALRFAANEPTLREMYANLLATGMDANTAQNAHPAFVEILKQLTPDEARLLAFLYSGHEIDFKQPALVSGRIELMAGGRSYTKEVTRYSLFHQSAECSYPHLVDSYYDNIRRLGLIDILQPEVDVDMGYPVKNISLEHQAIEYATKCTVEMLEKKGLQVPKPAIPYNFHFFGEFLYLTSLGEQFYHACINRESDA
jgi:hypothetical protein